jgi:hypothetical protein
MPLARKIIHMQDLLRKLFSDVEGDGIEKLTLAFHLLGFARVPRPTGSGQVL